MEEHNCNDHLIDVPIVGQVCSICDNTEMARAGFVPETVVWDGKQKAGETVVATMTEEQMARLGVKSIDEDINRTPELDAAVLNLAKEHKCQ